MKLMILNNKNVRKTFKTGRRYFKTSCYFKTSSSDLDRAYVPNQVEKEPLDLNYFKPPIKTKQCLSLILPPPNITGALHLGHALTATIQDILVKWKQMQGIETMWVPGLDHAGIATQVVVEKQLWNEKKKTRHDLGREKFNELVLQWKQEKSTQICDQLKRLGLSLNWDRQIFTMDPTQARIVTEVFINLFEKKLIYRNDSLVNWSCSLQSAISDIEVDHLEIDGPTVLKTGGKSVEMGKIYHFSYKICDSDDELIVATTRPETILGDVAVAVHPNDDRYCKFIGKKLFHPFRNEEIPIIADESVDMNYETGAVKITPAHNHNDLSIAKKHSLKILQVFNEKGQTTNIHPQFEGLDRFETRNLIIEKLENFNTLKIVKEHKMSVPICSRSGDIIEYLLKPQWFVDCSKMAEKAIEDVRNGKLTIEPKVFENVWFDWLENIRDWCISRQLWWGHRIPVYLCIFNDKIEWIAGKNLEETRRKASKLFDVPENVIEIKQDEDVLDTWFSSALLPFSVFEWPNNGNSKYYPLNLMETGHDILFFWVARMVMLGREITGELPFQKILLHGIICDSQGRKMSKSLGNVISPESIIEGITLKNLNEKSKSSHKSGVLTSEELQKTLSEHKKMYPDGIPECGTDALRFSLVSHNVKNHFINFDVKECHVNKLFCNKIWQASKFTKMWYEKVVEIQGLDEINERNISTIDRWILSRYSFMIEIMNGSLEKYEFYMTTSAFKDFFYYEFCDIYLEAAKRGLYQTDSKEAAGHCWTLIKVLEGSLRALYPLMPFISTHLHKNLPFCTQKNVTYPKLTQENDWRDETLENTISNVMETVRGIRRLKKIFNITKKHNINVQLFAPSSKYFDFKDTIEDLSSTNAIKFLDNPIENSSLIKDVLSNKVIIYLDLPEELRSDFRMDQTKLEKQKEKLRKELEKLNKMIAGSTYKVKASLEDQKLHEKKVAILEERISRIDFILNIL